MYVRKWLKANVIAVHAVNVWSYFPTLSKEGFVNYQLGFESKVTQNAKVWVKQDGKLLLKKYLNLSK